MAMSLLKKIRGWFTRVWELWSSVQDQEDAAWSAKTGEVSNSTPEIKACSTSREDTIPSLNDLVKERNRESGNDAGTSE
jgi:hypothetical protein